MIDWEDIEERLAYLEDKPDCIPEDIREWTRFREQYENALDFIKNYKTRDFSKPDMTKQFLEQKLHEIGYLGYGFKKSIFEVLEDSAPVLNNIDDDPIDLMPELDWETIENFKLFFVWNINLYNKKLKSLPSLPKYVGGSFSCPNNQLTTLDGAPQHVGGDFNCSQNELTTLEGAPQHVGGDFWCGNNPLTSLISAPQHVRHFYCSYNKLTSLEGAPQHVGGNFWCNNNQLPKSIPDSFPGKDLPKYINLKENTIMKNFDDFAKKLYEVRGGKRINEFGQFVNEAMSYRNIPVISYDKASRSNTTDFINIGTTPSEEDCAQANLDNSNLNKMNQECAAYIEQLIRVYGEAPGEAYFFICTNQHEFGEYREACLMFNPDSEEESDYAYEVETGCETWDEEARKTIETKPTNEAKDPYIEIRSLNHPIIGDAVKLLKHAGAKVVHTFNEFESVVDEQKFFSLAHSHCFYTEEEYNEFHKNGSKYTDKDSEKSTILKNTGDLVGVWDNKNGIGYVLLTNKK